VILLFVKSSFANKFALKPQCIDLDQLVSRGFVLGLFLMPVTLRRPDAGAAKTGAE